MSETEPEVIIVTGFGPFGGHELRNASWEAVRLLPESLNLNGKQFKILRLEVPVVYDAVNAVVPEIWSTNPKLVIHCGVHGNATCINLEKHAHNGGFCREDFSGKCIAQPAVCLLNAGASCSRLSTKIDVDRICLELNSEECPKFVASTDVGSYLCGYIYLQSLDQCCDRCLFIHVPPISDSYSPEVTSRGILNVLTKCVEQLG